MQHRRLVLTVTRKAVEVGNRWRFDEFPRAALIPGASGINFAIVAFARRIVEELTDQFGAMRPMLNGGLPMVSSASAKARMCVISRVMRN